MESINFASNKVGTIIHCDKVSADGYEASNLISDNSVSYFSSSTNRGFVAANCVYPPINLTLSFPHHICLERLIIDTKLNGLQTTSFEVYSCHFQNHKNKFDVRNSAFRQIGRVSNKEIHKFSFYNSFNESLKREGDLPLTHKYKQFLNSICALTIRLTASLNRTSFCLSSVKIFGTSVIPELQKSISHRTDVFTHDNRDRFSVNDKKLNNPYIKNKDDNLNTSFSNSLFKSDIGDKNSNGIPPEFFDVITQEIMSRPILLPSGHSIDQSTLDKHILEESKWSRKPSDPFTNIPFEKLLNPIINMPLKLRIDDYILKHKEQILDDSKNTSNYAANFNIQSYKSSVRCSHLLSNDSLKRSSKRTVNGPFEDSNSKKLKSYNGNTWEENEQLIYKHNIPNTFYQSSEETHKCVECDKIFRIDDVIYQACCQLMCQSCVLKKNNINDQKILNCKSCLNIVNSKNIIRIQLYF